MKILYYPHPILFYKCKVLKSVDKFIEKCMVQMQELMEINNGVGLAAPQVGLPYQFFITSIKELPIVINPVIYRYGGYNSKFEACLSIPKLNIKVQRERKVKLNGFDLKGNEINVRLEGDEARIVSHEYDHLHGIMIYNRADRNQSSEIRDALLNLNGDFINFDQKDWERKIEILEKERC